MKDLEDPKTTIDEPPPGLPPITKLKRRQWWSLVILNILLLISGQTTTILLAQFYHNKGAHTIWTTTLAQHIGFPILFIPYILFPSIKEHTTKSPLKKVLLIYFLLGCLITTIDFLYSLGSSYLSHSTYAVTLATHLAFNAIFSFYINSQRFTPSVLNSIVLLSLSASLVGVNNNSGESFSGSLAKHSIVFMLALLGSCLYGLLLPLTQLSFKKYIKKETFSVVLEMQIYTSIVASCGSLMGLFGSGEWRRVGAEVEGFGDGSASYVMTLAWTAMAWQVGCVGLVGLVFLVSSLFSDAISVFSLVITPVAGVVVFSEEISGGKIIAMIMGVWGCLSYVYQICADDYEAKNVKEADGNGVVVEGCSSRS